MCNKCVMQRLEDRRAWRQASRESTAVGTQERSVGCLLTSWEGHRIRLCDWGADGSASRHLVAWVAGRSQEGGVVGGGGGARGGQGREARSSSGSGGQRRGGQGVWVQRAWDCGLGIVGISTRHQGDSGENARLGFLSARYSIALSSSLDRRGQRALERALPRPWQKATRSLTHASRACRRRGQAAAAQSKSSGSRRQRPQQLGNKLCLGLTACVWEGAAASWEGLLRR